MTRKDFNNKVPWRKRGNDVFDPIIKDLMEGEKRDLREDVSENLSAGQSFKLTQLFKTAGFGRSTAHKFMTALVRHVGVVNDTGAIRMSRLKDRSKAGQKIYTDQRSSRDLARGRILIESPDQYEKVMQLLRSAKANRGFVSKLRVNGVRIAEDKHGAYYTDYIANPRKSGYAGSINLDLEIDVGKGKTATFELQIMPWDYENAYDHSHCLYSFIRRLDRAIEDQNQDQDTKLAIHTLRRILIRSNTAIFDEHAQRADYMQYRKTKPEPLSLKEARQMNDILDRISTAASQMMHTKNPKERERGEEILDAVKEAKTSIQNLLFSSFDDAHELITDDFVEPPSVNSPHNDDFL